MLEFDKPNIFAALKRLSFLGLLSTFGLAVIMILFYMFNGVSMA